VSSVTQHQEQCKKYVQKYQPVIHIRHLISFR
jgi:hypothetical protein